MRRGKDAQSATAAASRSRRRDGPWTGPEACLASPTSADPLPASEPSEPHVDDRFRCWQISSIYSLVPRDPKVAKNFFENFYEPARQPGVDDPRPKPSSDLPTLLPSAIACDCRPPSALPALLHFASLSNPPAPTSSRPLPRETPPPIRP